MLCVFSVMQFLFLIFMTLVFFSLSPIQVGFSNDNRRSLIFGIGFM